MFSVREKRFISEQIQNALRATAHAELPEGEIAFEIHVQGKELWSFAKIQNNGAIQEPSVNPWNEKQDVSTK